MPTNCEIIFDNNPKRVYYGGQTVCGKVHLKLAKEKIVRGIYIEFLGKAQCQWTEGTGNKKETHTGTEIYLENRHYFIGGRTGELVTIQPGEFNYSFETFLPLGLPTSLEAQNGHIRYGLQVVLDRPRWPDQKFEETFTVIKPLNLNNDISLRHPIVEEETKRFNMYCLFFCCAGHPLFMLASIPVSGYTPGQMINVDLELNNTSNENVSAFTIQILREVKFHTYENSATHITEKDAIATVETRGCYAQQKQAYTVNILVPPTPPTDLTASKIVHISYHLIIEGKCGCFHINPTITIPITIGSYPILDDPPNYGSSIIATAILNARNNVGQSIRSIQQQQHQDQEQHSTSLRNGNISAPQTPYPENDPPTYEQAIRVPDAKFSPTYPVYRRQTSYSSQTSTPVMSRQCSQ